MILISKYVIDIVIIKAIKNLLAYELSKKAVA